jgi:hypothetical protein
MNVAMTIPTGLGCKIGGHSGDGTKVAKILASACDTLFLHPNVVNGGDLNEMPPNSLYVEGSALDAFLKGSIGLRRVNSNRILVVTNKPVHPSTINCVNAAHHISGMDVDIVTCTEPLKMEGYIVNGVPSGQASGVDQLIGMLQGRHNYDAVAIHSTVDVDHIEAEEYFRNGGLNLWGAIEAYVSRKVSTAIGKPCAHAPVPADDDLVYRVCFPQIAPEMISGSFLFSVLKGLHRAPRIVKPHEVQHQDTYWSTDVDALVSPWGAWGAPNDYCLARKIPIIAVKENTCLQEHHMSDVIEAATYCEAAGFLCAMKAGVDLKWAKI